MASRLLPDSLLGVFHGEGVTKDVYRDVILIIAVLSAIYTLGLVTYRLVFSPIARFPGPKLAAATGFYETYYDVVKKGKFLFEIERMHDKYGMSLRQEKPPSC